MAIWDSYTFVSGERLTARKLRFAWDNLNELKTPRAAFKRLAPGGWHSTTSSTFVNVTDMDIVFRVSGGRRILFMAYVVAYASAADTVGFLNITRNGTSLGDVNNGVARIDWQDQASYYPLYHITEGVLAAGKYTYRVQSRRTSGTGTIETAYGSKNVFFLTEI